MHLTFNICLQTPPLNLDYALQKGSGNNYDLIQLQHSVGRDLYFNFSAELKGTEHTNSLPDFKGPFVQGPVAGRFVYINIGSYAHSADLCSGRIKVPLSGITWEVLAKSSAGLQTTIPGTGKNGGPTYATVKPFKGWIPGAYSSTPD